VRTATRRVSASVTVATTIGALTLGTAGLAAANDGNHATPPATAKAAATKAAAWLATQQAKAGYLKGVTGTADAGNTTYAVLAFHAAKAQHGAAARAVKWLGGHINAFAKDSGGTDQAAALAQLILAAHAAGVSPTAFGGTGASHDLVARLLATQQTTGSDAGLFGTQDPTYDGVFRQGFALAALGAIGQGSTSAATSAATWLENQQCADGGWMPYRADTTVACAPNPSLFVDEQTDQTSAALMGLDAIGADISTYGTGHPLANDPRTFLHAQQVSGGGFRYNTTGTADPNSTALGLQAVIALGDSPLSTAWKKGGKTAYDGLRSFQLKDGSLYYPSGGTPKANLLATVQAVPALAGYALPVPHTTIPVIAKPKPTPSPTPSPTPTRKHTHSPSLPPATATSSPAAAHGSTLPNTGSHTGVMSVVALLLLGLGAGFVALGSVRRERGRHTT
jgi:hypothetical protein